MKLLNYLRETKAELKHVIWPTRNQAIWYAVSVLLISGLVAYSLGFFDFLFSSGLQKILIY